MLLLSDTSSEKTRPSKGAGRSAPVIRDREVGSQESQTVD